MAVNVLSGLLRKISEPKRGEVTGERRKLHIEKQNATYSTQCTQLASRLFIITTATTGQKIIGSETLSDLLMMGVKTPETY